MTYLTLNNNHIINIDPLKELVNLKMIGIGGNNISKKSRLRLQRSVPNVYIH